MASEKKRSLAEDEAVDLRKAKKAKKAAEATANDDQLTERKKSKKDKKDKKVKKEKKKSKEVSVDDGETAEATEATEATKTTPADSLPTEKPKKEKKDKKDKKDRKKEKQRKIAGGADVDDTTTTGPAADEQLETQSTNKKQKKPVEDEVEENDAAANGISEDKSAKKAKKDKKGKKEKKLKRSSEENDAPAEASAVSNGNGTDGVTPTSYQYAQTAALSAVPEKTVNAFLQEHGITITDPSGASLRPILQFTQLPASRLISKQPFKGFTVPTPIQSASWPHALSGRDVVGIAETGSGKTLAFALPCIEALCTLPSVAAKPKHAGAASSALAVIVSPTRELAMQTHEQVSRLAALAGLRAVCLYGGAPKDGQRAELRRAPEIVVATPGRLKDFLSEGAVALGGVRFVVLDEADRMLDKGFEDDMREILGQCPATTGRQTLMFTATWPTSIQKLANTFMRDPVRVTIDGAGPRVTVVSGGDDREGGDHEGGGGTVELKANPRIAQKVEVVGQRDKEQRLLAILRDRQRGKGKDDRILVFCLYKKEATRVEDFLRQRGLKVAGIHGDLKQEQRTRSLEAFKTGQTTVLVATDVAARGLDIPEVKLVVNCTFPLTIEDYVHRIGRTGRAGKTGEAITLFTDQDKSHSGELINVLRAANQPIPEELMKFGTTVKKKVHAVYGAFGHDVDMATLMNDTSGKITFDD